MRCGELWFHTVIQQNQPTSESRTNQICCYAWGHICYTEEAEKRHGYLWITCAMNQSLHGGAIRDLVHCADEGMQVERGESMHVISSISIWKTLCPDMRFNLVWTLCTFLLYGLSAALCVCGSQSLMLLYAHSSKILAIWSVLCCWIFLVMQDNSNKHSIELS